MQDFVTSGEIMELTALAVEEAHIVGEQTDLVDAEIYNAMLGLQPLSKALENISRITGKSSEELFTLRTVLENKIFNPHPELGILKKIEPVVITQENKAEALEDLEARVSVRPKEGKQEIIERLSKRVEDAKQGIVAARQERNLPMIEKGENVHDVAPVAKAEERVVAINKVAPVTPRAAELQTPAPAIEVKPKISVPTPDYRYPAGRDPYREPIE